MRLIRRKISRSFICRYGAADTLLNNLQKQKLIEKGDQRKEAVELGEIKQTELQNTSKENIAESKVRLKLNMKRYAADKKATEIKTGKTHNWRGTADKKE